MVIQDGCRVNGNGFFEIDPTHAEGGLQDALDAIAAGGGSGGCIDLYPSSTGTYQLDDTVDGGNNTNIRINGNGATIGFTSTATDVGLLIRSRNWTLEGIRFSDTPASGLGTTQRRIISIDDNGSNGASNNVRILNCFFDVTLGTQTVQDYRCISAVGNADTSSTMRRGLIVQGCTFQAGVNSMPDVKYVPSTTTPYGISFIKTEQSGSQIISNNTFRGTVAISSLTNGTGLIGTGAGSPGGQTLQVLGSASSGASSISFDSTDATLTGTVQPGSTFTIASDSTNTTYKITKQATASGNAVTVFIYPVLAEAMADNDAVTITQTTAYGHCASAVSLIDHNQSSVLNNAFVLLSCQAARSGDGLPLIWFQGGTGESGHSQCKDNNIEDIDAWNIVRVESASAFRNKWVYTNGNYFGRIIPRCEAVISYSYAGHFTVFNNGFHNVEGGLHGTTQTNGYPIYFENCRTGAYGGNTYSITDDGEVAYFDGGGNVNLRHVIPDVMEYDY